MSQCVKYQIVLTALLCGTAASDEVTTVRLPEACSDFAIIRSTGDVVGVCTDPPHALKFSRDTLHKASHTVAGESHPPAEAAARAEVGAGACAVFCRQYGDRELIAVVGTLDPRLFLITADSFEIVKTIPLQAVDVWRIAGSQDATDPFLYYFHGQGHESGMGAVDLRTMTDLGTVLFSYMDGAVSADGNYAYCRGPHSPSGIDAFRRTNDNSAAKPLFRQIHDEHESAQEYAPDPFGEFTASGRLLFSSDLSRRVSQLPMAVECWGRRRPFAAGLTRPLQVQRTASSGTSPVTQQADIILVSSNTLLPAPRKVEVNFSGSAEAIPRGTAKRGDYKYPAQRRRLFSADADDELLCCFRNEIKRVPISLFGLPQEPFLRATLTSTRVTVGREHKLPVELADPQSRIEISLPGNATFADNVLTWTPRSVDVGTTALLAEVSSGEVRKSVSLPVTVEQPGVGFPFPIRDFRALPDHDLMVAWEEDNLKPQQTRSPQPLKQETRIAVAQISTGKIIADQVLPWRLKSLEAADDNLIVLPEGAPLILEVLNAENLDRRRIIAAGSGIREITIAGNLLILTQQQQSEIFDTSTWIRQSRQTDALTAAGYSPVRFDGLVFEGRLYSADKDSELKLVFNTGGIRALPAADPKLVNGEFLRPVPGIPTKLNFRQQRRDTQTSQDMPLATGGRTVSLNMTWTMDRTAGPRSSERVRQLSLTAKEKDSSEIETVTLESRRVSTSVRAPSPILHVIGDQAYVSGFDRVYHWNPSDTPAGLTSSETLHFTPRQSRITLPREGTLILKHQLKGQHNELLDLRLVSRIPGVRFDRTTLDVAVDTAVVLREAEGMLLRDFGGVADPVQLSEELASYRNRMASRVPGRPDDRPTGIPVGVPIHLRAIDSAGAIASLQYFVFADVDATELTKQLLRRVAERERLRAEAAAGTVTIGNSRLTPPAPVSQSSARGTTKDSTEALKDRIRQLEKQVAELTQLTHELRKNATDKE